MYKYPQHELGFEWTYSDCATWIGWPVVYAGAQVVRSSAGTVTITISVMITITIPIVATFTADYRHLTSVLIKTNGKTRVNYMLKLTIHLRIKFS